MTPNQRRVAIYATENLRCARIIAADPERYPGLMAEWAAIVLETDKLEVRLSRFATEAERYGTRK